MNTFEAVSEYVNALEIIDTHEHLPSREENRDRDTDILKEYLVHYFNRDLISAGLKVSDWKVAVDTTVPLRKRWEILEPYWDVARITGYGRALDISVQELYGINRICGSTIERLNENFLASLKKGHFRKVLHEKARIRTSLLDNDEEFDIDENGLGADSEFFRPVYRLDRFILPRGMDDIKSIEATLDLNITSLDRWLQATSALLETVTKHGAVALKCALAYERSLLFERATFEDAAKDFNGLLARRHSPDWVNAPIITGKPFQDYMMHFVLDFANSKNLTIQFHTGLQEGNGNYILNSNPALLSNLFLQYPKVRFDLMHMGYPFQQIVSALSKNYPNVFIDLCWAHIVSPRAAVLALEEFLDAVPYNKISAFGGDYRIVDAVFGHQYLARVNVSRSLTEKIEDRSLDLETAKVIAKSIFFDNPVRIFNL